MDSKRVTVFLALMVIALLGAVATRASAQGGAGMAWCCNGGSCAQMSGWKCAFRPACSGPGDCGAALN